MFILGFKLVPYILKVLSWFKTLLTWTIWGVYLFFWSRWICLFI